MKRIEFHTRLLLALLAFSVGCAGVQAQSGAGQTTNTNKNVRGSGTPGKILVWTAPDTAGDSSITELNGNIGIGTTTPGSKLAVAGRIEAFVVGNSAGVLGQSSTGSGVRGNSDTGFGVFGSSNTGEGTRGTSNGSYGVFGFSQNSDGIFGQSNSNNGSGVVGFNNNGGTGVMGQALDGTGVRGISTNGFGLWGTSTAFTAVQAQSDSGYGVFASSNSSRGVHGQSNTNTGVHGQSGSGYGVYGTSGTGTGVVGQGFNGVSGEGSGSGNGVYGSSPLAVGVFGTTDNGVAGVFGNSGSGSGVTGFSINGPAITGIGHNGVAGQFIGDVNISGNLTKGGGSFKIDHPLEPANKYLYHSFVESPDMMNIYNGNVVTDANGEATVALPDYFEALNKDFRYQLTVIGQFAQAIVASELKDNRFQIKTDKPDVKVSWQVTGIRQDAWANNHRIPTEIEKPEAERGYYLHPELYGQPAEKSIEWVSKPELMRRTRALQLQRLEGRDPQP